MRSFLFKSAEELAGEFIWLYSKLLSKYNLIGICSNSTIDEFSLKTSKKSNSVCFFSIPVTFVNKNNQLFGYKSIQRCFYFQMILFEILLDFVSLFLKTKKP